MNDKKDIKICRHCLYGIKHYVSIGNKFFFERVSECSNLRRSSDGEQTFQEKTECLFFEKDQIPSPYNDTEQKLLRMYIKMDEIMDTLTDIFIALHPIGDDDTEQRSFADKISDK